MTTIRLIQILQKLARDHRKKVFTLRDIAALAGESRPAAAMTLIRASKRGLVGRVGSLWINLMEPPELLEVALALPSPSYLSFESALYRHGVFSQSPRGELTMATTGRSGSCETPLGTIRRIHLKPALFFGFDEGRIAFPEKAWLDLIYLRGRKGRSDLVTETVYFESLDRKLLKKFAGAFPEWVGPSLHSVGQ